MKNLIKNTGSQQIAVAKQQAKKTGESWYIFGTMVGNEKGRIGYEQYEALRVTPDGEFQVIAASPRS